MKINFRQGIVSHQTGGFLQFNTSGYIDLLAANKPLTVTIAHKGSNYLASEDSDVTNAWVGTFSTNSHYWLYIDYDLLTFDRTFGYTEIEPIVQSIEPSQQNVNIVHVVPGVAGVGAFVVENQYELPTNKPFNVINSTGNDGMYTVNRTVYNPIDGTTTIVVNQVVPSYDVDGHVTLNVDSYGNALAIPGRTWYDTINSTHYEYVGPVAKREVLRVFVARVFHNQFLPVTITGGSFIGTQIGNTSTVFAGRVIFDEDGVPVRRDNRTFFNTEDQFFANASRVDAIRLESNVARAQSQASTMASFQVVAWTGEGKVNVAYYDDISTTVLGIVTEPLQYKETGSIIIQGVITSDTWNWTTGTGAVPVGSALWVNDGELITYDPHVADPVQYPIGRVPVARVLSNNTVIFEQGLGGKGDRGPTGTVEDIPPATTTKIGGVTLVSPSSDPEKALVISDLDPRLSDARVPLSHTHIAANVTYVPTAVVSSNNVQSAVTELGNNKVNRSGDLMTGFLRLHADPTQDSHAATKHYVDGLVSGLIWLTPACLVNVISDTQTIPPGNPYRSDAYIVPVGALGAWSGVNPGNVVIWDGSAWIDSGALTELETPFVRVGISMTSPTSASGNLAGHDNEIAIFDSSNGELVGFEVPTVNNAIYICNESSLHAYFQYAYDGEKWVQFGGSSAINAGSNLVFDGNTLNVLDWDGTAEGGSINAESLQGLTPDDLDLIYSDINHGHAATDISFAQYITSPNWGTPLNVTETQLTNGNVRTALLELVDKKAARYPVYATVTDLPSAALTRGMFAFIGDTEMAYVSTGTAWKALAMDIDLENHSHMMPYDITFFSGGSVAAQTEKTISSFVSTRTIVVDAGVTNVYAHVLTPSSNPVQFELKKNGIPTGSYILFGAGQSSVTGTVVSQITLVPGDRLDIESPSLADTEIRDLSISIVACGDMGNCPV